MQLASGSSKFSVLVSDHSPHSLTQGQPNLIGVGPHWSLYQPAPGLGLQAAACKVTDAFYLIYMVI